MTFEGNTWYTHLLYSLIAIIAFSGNALVLYILISRSTYLKHSYNIFICNLAVTDIITSIMLIFSRYLYLPPMPTGKGLRVAYCETIWAGWILFTLGYVSIYTCLALAIERWLAVVKPHVYTAVKSNQAVKVVVLVWVLGIAVNISTLFRVQYNKATQQCVWAGVAVGKKELPWLDFTMQSIIPFSCMILLYGHIVYTLRNLPFFANGCGHSVRKITIVALVTSMALIIGWLPSRVTFMLSKFGYLDSGGVLHFCLVMLAFSNSCVNPFLYGIYTSEFRKEYKKVFYNIVGKLRARDRSVHTNFDLEPNTDKESRAKTRTLFTLEFKHTVLDARANELKPKA